MAVITKRGSIVRVKTFNSSDYSSHAQAITPFDIASNVSVGATTVLYTYPMTANERIALFNFTGLVCATGVPGNNGMYQVMARFVRDFFGVVALQGTVLQPVAQATVGGYNVTVGLSGTNVQISVTVPAGPDSALARVVGEVYEIKAPVPP